MIQSFSYLNPVIDLLAKPFPKNKIVNIVCHGHSVPAGYFATPFVNTFSAYPHLLHQLIKERYPFAVANVIVTGIGAENSERGEKRFQTDVLNHNPDVLTIDYSLNDRGISLESARTAWKKMIESALEREIKVILCTPTWDQSYLRQDEEWRMLVRHAEQVRELADEYSLGLADSFDAFERHVAVPSDLAKYLSHVNHPTKAGHLLVAEEIAKYFLAR